MPGVAAGRVPQAPLPPTHSLSPAPSFPLADYSTGVTKLGEFADYLVINISSPNTPGGWLL